VDTLQRFVQKASCFIDQYNNYRLPELAAQLGDNNTVNGRLTITENIADNGGIREALQAYRYYIQDRGSPEPRLPGLEKYNPEQLFFLAFAQVANLRTVFFVMFSNYAFKNPNFYSHGAPT